MYKYKLAKYKGKYEGSVQHGGKQSGCHPLSTTDCSRNERDRCARVEDGQGDGKCICSPSTKICVSTTSDQGLHAVNQRLYQDLQQLQETLDRERAKN